MQKYFRHFQCRLFHEKGRNRKSAAKARVFFWCSSLKTVDERIDLWCFVIWRIAGRRGEGVGLLPIDAVVAAFVRAGAAEPHRLAVQTVAARRARHFVTRRKRTDAGRGQEKNQNETESRRRPATSTSAGRII